MKRLQIDLPDYIVQAMQEIQSKSDWKDKDIVIRAIENLYRDFIAVDGDILRLTEVYRKIDSDENFGFLYFLTLRKICDASSVSISPIRNGKDVVVQVEEGAAHESLSHSS